MKSHILRIVKGFFIGLSVLIPGVSGGTMAVILGVYDELIDGISDFFKDMKHHILILGEIGVGAVIGLLSLSKLLEYLLLTYKVPMQFLFIGVVIGGLPTLFKKANAKSKNSNKIDYFYLILGFVLVLFMMFKPAELITFSNNKSLLGVILLFVAGIIVAVAFILPGISGSFMLLTLGLYEVTLSALNNLSIGYLLPLLLGTVFGVITTTKIIKYNLKKHPRATYFLIIGFVIGSILTIFPGFNNDFNWCNAILMIIIGFLPILYLGKRNLID